ncbi:MAG: glycosyltransferase family 39 protein [Planctomycetes bacterium]|nr:glycosyltransferase family 39 protein [Planctomycetota bacterium]
MEHRRTAISAPSLRAVALIFLFALLLRGGWGAFSWNRDGGPAALEFPDEQQYWLMAQNLRSGEGLKDEFGFRATRMPLYPATLALFAGLKHGIIAAKVANWLVGALAAVAAAQLAGKLFGSRVGVVAGLAVAVDPYLVASSSLLLTETPFVAALLALYCLVTPSSGGAAGSARPGRAVVIGATAAVCVYLRESSVGLVVAVVGTYALWAAGDRRPWKPALLAGSIVVLALLPWVVRNRFLLGEWLWFTSRGGVSLYDGVRIGATGSSNLANVQQMAAVRGLSEGDWNRYFWRESLRCIADDPGRIADLAVRKLARTWNPVPNVETYQSRLVRLVAGGWSVPVFALAVVAVVGLPRIRGRGGLAKVAWLLLPALYFSMLHAVFVGSVRYRLPAMPMIEILAAVALVGFLDRFRGACRVTPHSGAP